MKDRLKAILKPLASLKLTVVLFALAMVLIFTGTLAQAEEGTWVIVDRYFRSAIAWIDLQLLVPESVARIDAHLAFPGGFVILGAMLVNLIAAHAVRFKLTWRRAGIVIMHAGVILLLSSEVATALLAEEGQMTIREGESSNYVEHIRTAEFYVIDRAPEDHQRVTVVPEAKLEAGGPIRHEQLPFTVRVDRWMTNSKMLRGSPSSNGVQGAVSATRGRGQTLTPRQTAPAAGVDSEVNMPSAYVTLTHNGETLGTWLISIWLEQPQPVEVDGKTYHIGLRFQRTYKPYTIHLIDFKHDKFTGTDKPRNFSSRVQLIDPAQNEKREVLIYMNHPLYYSGETFYQSAFLQDNSGTVLQVVNNPAWWIPYASCILVAAGMLLHFGQHLTRFMRNQTGRSARK